MGREMGVEGSNRRAPVDERLVDIALRVLLLTCAPLLALSLLRAAQMGWLPIMAVHAALLGGLVASVVLRRKLGVDAKAGVLVLFFAVIAGGAVITNASFIWGAPYFLLALVASSLFFARQVTAALMAAGVLFGAIHEYAHAGTLSPFALLHLMSVSVFALVVIFVLARLKGELSQMVVTLATHNESLRQAREAAIAASKTKSDFLANMSHEIRTPMTGILGVTQMLRDTQLDARGQEYVEIIRSSGEALLALLNDILDLSKIEASKLEIESVPLSVPALVDDIVAMMRVRAEDKGIDLRVDLRDALPDHLCGDPTRVRQILLNLVGNAVKFTERGAVEVVVELLEREDDEALVAFTVRDTGIGIDDAKLPLIFRSFGQADASMARRYGGTGLGLAISKHLVRLMGGEIGVRSELGRGSEFWFQLPLRVSAARPSPSPSASPAAAAFDPRGRRVLLAEDNEVNILITTTLLSKLGFASVAVAKDGLQALDRLSEAEFDLVFMDMQMPELDGLEAVRRLRAGDAGEHNVAVPVIALTANAMKGDDARCRGAGMDDYLSKPIDLDDLAAKIATWLPRDGAAPPARRRGAGA
ncbi:MAG: ATP-binding protein [Nannocystaceae bacterium]